MKKKIGQILTAGVILTGILLLGSNAAQTAPPTHPRPAIIDLRPDLRVKLIMHLVGFFNSSGARCYKTNPVYTVTNKGRTLAKKFTIKVYMRRQGETGWHFFEQETVPHLKPGEIHSKVWDVENVWCPNGNGNVGFRVVIDADNEVNESNEHNNTAETFYDH